MLFAACVGKNEFVRKRDVSSVVDAVASYVGNNPTGLLASNNDQLNDSGQGVSSEPLGKYIDTLSTSTDSVKIISPDNVSTYANGGALKGDALKGSSDRTTKIVVIRGYTCSSTTTIKNGSKRSYAVVGGVETTGTPEPYCQSAN